MADSMSLGTNPKNKINGYIYLLKYLKGKDLFKNLFIPKGNAIQHCKTSKASAVVSENNVFNHLFLKVAATYPHVTPTCSPRVPRVWLPSLGH